MTRRRTRGDTLSNSADGRGINLPHSVTVNQVRYTRLQGVQRSSRRPVSFCLLLFSSFLLVASLGGQSPKSSLARAKLTMAFAISCGRILRFLRSIITPVTTVLAFSTLLTWMFILYQPTKGPGDIQGIGWQAWDSISMDDLNTGSDTEVTTPSTESDGSDNDVSNGVDWWNVTTGDKVQDTSSFPLDKWMPLLPHATGCASSQSIPDTACT